jgi:pimeloyl-ACP methyl ester carboxylesterase
MKKLSLLTILLLTISSCSLFGTREYGPEDQGKETVILLHGFGRSLSAMKFMDDQLYEKGYKVHRVGYSSFSQNVEEIKKEVDEKINYITQGTYGKIHFVGHSFGGLLIRSHLDRYKVKNLGRVVTMGSPNKGVEAIKHLKEKWYFAFAGTAALSMENEKTKFLKSLKVPYYPLGVIAGTKERSEYEHIIPGPDDGLVSVESTRVKGMKDFVTIHTTHTRMRTDLRVIDQVVSFLKKGKFENKEVSHL